MVTVFMRPPPVSKTSSRPSRIVTPDQLQADLPSGMAPSVPVLDPVVPEQPSGVDVQFLCHGVRFNLRSQKLAQFCGTAGPFRAIRRDPFCHFLQDRLRRFLPQIGLNMIQIPAELLLIPKEIQALILLIPPGYFQRGGVGCSSLLLEKEPSVRRTHQAVRTGDHIEWVV